MGDKVKTTLAEAKESWSMQAAALRRNMETQQRELAKIEAEIATIDLEAAELDWVEDMRVAISAKGEGLTIAAYREKLETEAKTLASPPLVADTPLVQPAK